MKRRTIGPEARLNALRRLLACRPRTRLSDLAQLVDAAGDLLAAGHGSDVAGSVLRGLRLSVDDLADVIDELMEWTAPKPADERPALRSVPLIAADDLEPAAHPAVEQDGER